MKVKLGLRIKFFIIFLIFMTVLAGATAYVTKHSFERVIIDKYYDQAIGIAKLAADILDGDRIKLYAEDGGDTAQYQADLEMINRIKNTTDAYYVYVMYPFSRESGIYIFDAAMSEEQRAETESEESLLGEGVDFGTDFPSALKVMETGMPSETLDITTTVQGEVRQTLASAYAPIFDSAGSVVAFAGVDVNMSDVDTYVRDVSLELNEAMVCIMGLCIIVLLVVVQISVIRPVRRLKQAAENLSEGIYGKPIQVRGSDEISEITRVFNRMSANIGDHVSEMNRLNEAYYKYVPSRFFELLGKERVVDMKLADQRQIELAVQNFNINGFDEQIRQMSSEKMFIFINHILHQAIPDVVQKEGIIETFHEGGFTALYPDHCEMALNSAISICQSMNKVNDGQGLGADSRVEFGFGIAYGSVMLGTVGHDSRMEVISISHQTEIAAFLQKISSKYYSRILITGTAASKIPDFSKAYHARVIGYLYNTFSNQMERIYDVYDGDEEEDKRCKDMTKSIFEEGVRLYCTRNFYEARIAFVEVLKQFRQDAAAREYLYRCNQYYQAENEQEIDIYMEKF